MWTPKIAPPSQPPSMAPMTPMMSVAIKSAALLARQNGLCNSTGNESENQVCDETHEVHIPSDSG